MTIESSETHWILRLDGGFGMASVAELRARLLEGLASAKAMELDLSQATEIDITVLQLLWAAGNAAAREKRAFVSRATEALSDFARAAGFESFPGVTAPPAVRG